MAARERQWVSRDFLRRVLRGDADVSVGFRPDYGSGPHLLLVGAAVELARRDLADPLYQADAREFLRGELVALFAECLGTKRRFDA